MKDREKQIEEMRKDIFAAFCGYAKWEEDWQSLAEAVYNAGYRKASKVAREIFEEIEQVMSSLDRRYMASGNPKQSWGVRGAMAEIAELKKKYTEEKDGTKTIS